MGDARQIQGAKEINSRSAANQSHTSRSAAQLMPEEELVQGKSITQLMDEEELMQGKFNTTQLAMDEEDPMQGKFEATQLKQTGVMNTTQLQEQTADNTTGMSDQLKGGIESLSGVDVSDVKVHYNSSKPAQMNAHAYAQGTDIHVASGQEKHVPHEAWHTVQQKQGRVQPTTNVSGVPVNDNPGLENEADVMGAKALQAKSVANVIQQKEEDL